MERKSALCGGYAFLFRDLCKELDIEAVAIHGFSNKYSKNYLQEKVDHTWNAVYLDGRWRLLDITYETGVSNNKKHRPKWFDCDPNLFLNTHYPQDIRWSLVKNTPSRSIAFGQDSK